MTRRVLSVLAVVVALAAVVVLIVQPGSDDDSGYTVRAIFDNAGFAAQGEDVKVAGAIVGTISALDVTADRKAAVDLQIDDSRFTPFHANAKCTVRSEGLLAVKFVDCDPGTSSQPQLRQIEHGPGAGTYLLPVTQTSSPVDLDVVNNMLRQPRGQELALLISELGTGLAARGKDLNTVIRRAAPALGQTNRVLAKLARQNKTMDAFVENADRVLVPLATQRRQLAGWIRSASTTATASASSSQALEAGIKDLPAFLSQLRSSMVDLGALADATTPVLSELHVAAPSLGQATQQLTGFSKAAGPALISSGAFAQQAGPDLIASQPFIGDLSNLAGHLDPVAQNLDRLTASLKKNQTIERTMGLIFNAANAVNGYDSAGHFARVEVLSSACSEYTGKGFFGCDAQWGPTASSAGPITNGPTTTTVPAGTAPLPGTTTARSEPLLDYLLAP